MIKNERSANVWKEIHRMSREAFRTDDTQSGVCSPPVSPSRRRDHFVDPPPGAARFERKTIEDNLRDFDEVNLLEG